ncbi:putative cobalamin binding protein [Thiorhodovibrio frisius]|uniref:Putative cobalamin binding protein n=1 Tax=Thiorhodovibrio frisius TaxID=631362 RepID=H8Z7D9_9GAMM|nr:putative cobalamin binding protein [Thiorhodovibrio frisius]WPL20583.1 putative cobalamin binding protein [Thiorhodovibrio frisius]
MSSLPIGIVIPRLKTSQDLAAHTRCLSLQSAQDLGAHAHWVTDAEGDADTLLNQQEYAAYLDALLAGDYAACAQRVQGLIDRNVDLKALYVQVFERSLYDVGKRWERNEISVATEHLATSITESLLTLGYPRLFGGTHKPFSAVVSCVANEFHQLGGQMVADTLELNGWHGYFLGPNVPLKDLLGFVEDKQPDILALSISVFFNMPALTEALEAICARFPALPTFIGGQAFAWGGSDRVNSFPNAQVILSLADFESRLREIERKGCAG